MNIFRLAGDMTHLASVLVLLLKIHTIKSCAVPATWRTKVRIPVERFPHLVSDSLSDRIASVGNRKYGDLGIAFEVPCVSLKTQELYALVFACRYLDIFTYYVSLYNTIMKLIFLGSSFSIVWYMRYHKVVRRSYDKDQDTFRHYFLVLPCLLLALLINEKFTFKEVMWTFSLYLEAVAILPQLVLLQRTRNIDNLTGQYVFLLGAYRALYILNWIYRYFTEPHFVHWIRLGIRSPLLSDQLNSAAAMSGVMQLQCVIICLLRPSLSAILTAKCAASARCGGPWRNRAILLQVVILAIHVIRGINNNLPSDSDVEYLLQAAWISGLVQTLLYADFFYYYFQSWKNNKKLHLPA
ncbi:ER lumen protein-retaining receptor B [Glycine soja]|uniref:ER lumen protein-retaining receptor n=1 Tax=Glycine soja TaxID=3848 RepID=A0A445FU46_GLYSO|nr:ER lumen protein-retaining receptor B [Glycine soja]